MCYWGRGKEEFKHSFALKLALILQKIMRSLGWLVFFKRWVYEFCAYLCNSHFSVKSEVASSTSVQRSTLFPPSFLNITNNVTVFFPTCSQIHSQHWKRPSPPGSANRCYPASHRRRIPICLAHWPAIPFGSCPFTLNCRAAKKLVFMKNRCTSSFFLYQIKDTWSLRMRNVLAYSLPPYTHLPMRWQQRTAAFPHLTTQLARGRCWGLFCRRGSDQIAKPVQLPAGPHT